MEDCPRLRETAPQGGELMTGSVVLIILTACAAPIETPGLTESACNLARLEAEVHAAIAGEPVETACEVEV
jgi:hypothetical protein